MFNTCWKPLTLQTLHKGLIILRQAKNLHVWTCLNYFNNSGISNLKLNGASRSWKVGWRNWKSHKSLWLLNNSWINVWADGSWFTAGAVDWKQLWLFAMSHQLSVQPTMLLRGLTFWTLRARFWSFDCLPCFLPIDPPSKAIDAGVLTKLQSLSVCDCKTLLSHYSVFYGLLGTHTSY